MFKVIDCDNNHLPVKGGFPTAAAANNWCKKHLDVNEVHLCGHKPTKKFYRYCIMMR